MFRAVERLGAIGAAAMLALNPVTAVQGREASSICGQIPRNIGWGGKGNAPGQPFHAVKACHACLPEKRKLRPGRPDPASA